MKSKTAKLPEFHINLSRTNMFSGEECSILVITTPGPEKRLLVIPMSCIKFASVRIPKKKKENLVFSE